MDVMDSNKNANYKENFLANYGN